MIFGIVTGVILGLMALVVLGGVMKGRKAAWQYTACRLANVVVSAVIAVIVSALIGKALGNLISKELMNLLPDDVSAALGAMPSASGLVSAFVAMFLAPILFYFIFAIVRGIIGLFVPSIAYAMINGKNKGGFEEGKKLSKKKLLKIQKGGPVGMLLGGVCALCLFIVLAAPLTAYVTVANGVMMMGQSDNEIFTVAAEVTDAVSENMGTKAVKKLGGDLLVANMTSYELSGEKSNLTTEMKLVTAIGKAVHAVNDNNVDRAEAASVVREVGDAFEETKFLPAAMAELLDSASDSWSEGEKFAGVNAPSLGENSEVLTKEIYTTFDDSNTETVKKDAHTIANIIACIVEAEAFDEIKGNFISVLENEDVSQKILFELLDNDHLDGMVGGLMNYGVEVLCNSLEIRHDMDGIYGEFLADLEKIDAGTDPSDEEYVSKVQTEYKKLFDKYGIKISDQSVKDAAIADANGVDMVKWLAEQEIILSENDFIEKSVLVTAVDINLKDHQITDKAAEAVKLAKALHSVVTLSEQLKGNNDTVNTVTELGPVLDAFAQTESVGTDCTGDLLVAILQSDKVSKNVGFDHIQATNIADSINSGAKNGGYSSQMTTLGQTVNVLQTVSKKENSKEAVGMLMKDLTPETAKTVQTVTTPNVMIENGVPEKSAEPASNMMSDMLGGLGDAKGEGMSDEQLDKETVAVNNVINTAMNIDSSHESVFGDNSATGVTAEQYVNDMMDSQIVSQTIIDHVFGEGDTPNIDPLNSERVLTEAETNDLVDALNNKWQNASAEEKSDPNFDKTLVALAALINVKVDITANGVVAA